MRKRRHLHALTLFTLAFAVHLGSIRGATEERIDYGTNAKVRQEGRERSQILRTMHFLTDVYGPRLTGSPNHKAAAEWAIKQMKDWGFENAHLEPWDFGRTGWLNERLPASSPPRSKTRRCHNHHATAVHTGCATGGTAKLS
jgi:hypothetical protein